MVGRWFQNNRRATVTRLCSNRVIIVITASSVKLRQIKLLILREICYFLITVNIGIMVLYVVHNTVS